MGSQNLCIEKKNCLRHYAFFLLSKKPPSRFINIFLSFRCAPGKSHTFFVEGFGSNRGNTCGSYLPKNGFFGPVADFIRQSA